MAVLDWSQCDAVESVPGKMSGAWVLKGTRMPVSAIFENLEAGASISDIIAERFKLVVRRETKGIPVYELTVAEGGAKLREIKPGDPVPMPQPANSSLAHVFFVESMHDLWTG